LITGTSSGVGLSLAVQLAKSTHPYRVYATLRNLSGKDKLEAAAGDSLNKNLFILKLDVTDDASVTAAVDHIIKTEGRIDILVNNAGAGQTGPLEGVSIQEAKDCFEVNFFGVVRVTKAVLPHLKKQESGQIIQLSSVGGINGVPFNDIYCSAKFALEGFSESLAPLLKAFNVSVTLIEPGPILTNFVSNATRDKDLMESRVASADDKTRQLFVTYRERMIAGFNPDDAETGDSCAEKIIKTAIENPLPPFRFQTNPKFAVVAQLKFKDPSGSSGVDASYQRFFAQKL